MRKKRKLTAAAFLAAMLWTLSLTAFAAGAAGGGR